MGVLRAFRTGWPGRQPAAKRVEPTPGTESSLYNSIIPNFWAENGLGQFSTGFIPGNAALADRVWVASRCIQLNSQQIASMPLQFHGGSRPAWIDSPDPNWYPNGIGDALHSIVQLLYGWGFACLYVTDTYADGFPRNWTVIDSARIHVYEDAGRRVYKLGDTFLDPARIVQIDRNPGVGATGTPAIRSYAQMAYGLLAAGNQALAVTSGGTPKFYLKSETRLTKEQAELMRAQWMEAASSRNGAPPIIPPHITPTEMSFDPSELALLDQHEFSAKAIATAYGVPAVLLNQSVDGFTYQNPALLGEMWWRFELRPTATRIANALTAQMLPRGQWVTFDAADTFAEITERSDDDDPQLSQVSNASPAQQPRSLTAIGGGG